MPRSSAQNEARKRESRDRLVEAATRVFTAKGYAGARMADIAGEARMSHGLSFHYFPNKEAMFIAVVEATMGYASDMSLTAAAGSGPAIEKLEHLCCRMLEGAQKNPAHTAIMFQTSSSATVPEGALKILRGASDDIFVVIATLISEAQTAGQLDEGDPQMLARALLATISGLALSVADKPQPDTFPALEVVMRVLRPLARS